jgi:hypothetical protein
MVLRLNKFKSWKPDSFSRSLLDFNSEKPLKIEAKSPLKL